MNFSAASNDYLHAFRLLTEIYQQTYASVTLANQNAKLEANQHSAPN